MDSVARFNQPALRFALQRAVETGPTLLIDLALQALLHLQFAARPEPFGGQFAARSRIPWAM